MSALEKTGFRSRHPILFTFLTLLAVAGAFVAATSLFSERRPAGPRIGLVTVEGLIADAGPAVEFLRELREDASVKGIILRVNSPGGVVGPSQELFRAVERAAKVKPVVASMGAVAASGGYYVACPAGKILANPATLTGSIGVKLETYQAEELAARLGVGQEVIASGKYKDLLSVFRKPTPEAREHLREVVMDMHEQFVADVAASRKMDVEKVRALADGRIFTGRRAVEEGLADGLGGLEEALEAVKTMAQVAGEPELVKKSRRKSGFFGMALRRFLPDDDDASSDALLKTFGQSLGAALGESIGARIAGEGRLDPSARPEDPSKAILAR